MNRTRIFAVAAPVLAIVIGVFGRASYADYVDLGRRLPPDGVPVRVTIDPPGRTALFVPPPGTPLAISVRSLGRTAIASVELWVDGQLVGVQRGTGQPALDAVFPWAAPEAGVYSLVARARDADRNTAMSEVIDVVIARDRGLRTGTGASDAERPLSVAYGGSEKSDIADVPPSTPPGMPARREDLAPAEHWRGTVRGWARHVLRRGVATAPQLAVAVRGCDIVLGVQRGSADEEGFFVYRRHAGAGAWQRIASLTAPRGTQWLSYTDAAARWPVSYYVAAFDRRGESPSDPVVLRLGREECAATQPTAPVASISLMNLVTPRSIERAYCDVSVGGVAARWPAADFFTATDGRLATEGMVERVLLPSSPIGAGELTLDCRGWSDGAWKNLGTLRRAIDLRQSGTFTVRDANLSAQLAIDREKFVTPFGGKFRPGPSSPEILDSRMPNLLATVTHDPEQCKQHLPNKGSNFLEALICAPFPQYTLDTQPYLTWTAVEGGCANGEVSQGADCRTVAWYRQRADTYGGLVGYRIGYEHKTGAYEGLGYPGRATTPDRRTAYVIPPLEPYDEQAPHANLCGTTVQYRVQMFYDAGPNDPEFANLTVVSPSVGRVSWKFICPAAPPTEVAVDVTIDKLHFGSVHDNDSGSQSIEVYGYFMVQSFSSNGPVTSALRILGTWGVPARCPAESGAFLDPLPVTDDCPWRFKASTNATQHTDVSTLPLCACDSLYDYNGPWKKNNNTIRVNVEDDDVLVFSTVLVDYDAMSGNDNVCVGIIQTGRRPLDAWAKVNDTGAMVQGDNGHASCVVTYKVRAVSP